MFFLFRKVSGFRSQETNSIIHNNVSISSRVFLISTNHLDIKTFILPLHFILKNWESFLVIYNIQSIRNYAIIKNSFRWLLVRKNYQTFLIPSKKSSHVIRILFLLKIPFHFGLSTRFGRVISPVDVFTAVQHVYGFIKLNMYVNNMSNI